MELVVEKTPGGRDYKIKDLSQADFGRLEIERSQLKMIGLVASRAEFGPYKPLKGARITISSPITAQYAVTVETMTALGAEVRWCSCNFSSTQDHVAAAIARDGSVSVFAWAGQTPEEYWWCIERAIDWGPVAGGPDLIVDYGGDAALLIHESLKAEESYEKTGQLPEPSSTDEAELKIVLSIIRDGLKTDPMRYRKMKERLVGVSEDTTAGVKRLYQMQVLENLWFPAINVNDSVTVSKFRSLFGCRYALHEGFKKATGMMISEKKAVVYGYDDPMEAYAIALKQAGADVVVYEVDPNLAVQARLGGFSVIETLDDVVSVADIFVCRGIMKGEMKKMKNNAIIYDMDTILDSNYDNYAGLEQEFPGMEHIIVDSRTDKLVFPETNSSISVLRNKGYPNFMLSWSCTSHVVAMLDLWSKKGSGKYENRVYALSEHLEEKVSALHLGKLTTRKETKTKGRFDFGSGQIEEERENLFATTASSDAIMSKRRILYKGVQACSLFGIVALGLTKASKVSMELSFSAIWGN